VGYLDQLKNCSDVPDDGPKETKELPNPNCLGFLGPSYRVSERIHALSSSSRWLLHFSDRNPLTVALSPAATHAEVLDTYPDALAAEPIEPGRRQPDTLLAGEQEPAILVWLTAIGETDQAALAGVLEYCRRDHEALAYFAGRAAAEQPKPDNFPDDRRPCNQCTNLYCGACIIAKPGGLVSALRGYRPSLADVRIRCAGYSMKSNHAKDAT